MNLQKSFSKIFFQFPVNLNQKHNNFKINLNLFQIKSQKYSFSRNIPQNIKKQTAFVKAQQVKQELVQQAQERVVYDSKQKKVLSQFELMEAQNNFKSLSEQDDTYNQTNGISVPKVVIQQERLSKYLSQTGMCSRRQAEEMISQGLVFVDGKKVKSNQLVSVKNDIKIFTVQGEKVPLPQDTKIYLFYKPRGLLCTNSDPLGRPTIFDWMRGNTKLDADHIISVGRLDFNSEGLLLLTNNGELASMLENPMSKIMREYRVRVHGKLDAEKLLKVRQGAVINGVQYGPFEVDIDNRQTSNTWLKIRMFQGKNREIRKVMQKYDLSVNRLKRLQYGCYKIGKMVPGDLFETMVFKEIKRKFYLHLRKKFENYNSDIRQQLMEKYGDDIQYIEEKDLTEDERLYLANNAYDPNDQTYFLKSNDTTNNRMKNPLIQGFKSVKKDSPKIKNQATKKTHKQLLLEETRVLH